MEFRNKVIPSAGTFFSTSLFGLSGLVNVALLLYTRSGASCGMHAFFIITVLIMDTCVCVSIGLLLLNEPVPDPVAPRLWEPVSERTSMSSEDAGLGLRLRTGNLTLPEAD